MKSELNEELLDKCISRFNEYNKEISSNCEKDFDKIMCYLLFKIKEVIPGKERCDLLLLDVILDLCSFYGYQLSPLKHINNFIITGDYKKMLMCFESDLIDISELANILLDVSRQFESSTVKHEDNNWYKGVQVKHYINGATRHYLKYIRGDKSEMHKVAYMWNVLCAIWICKNKPNLNDYKNTSSDK